MTCPTCNGTGKVKWPAADKLSTKTQPCADCLGTGAVLTLDTFLPLYEADDNEWWRLSSGHHQNLFEEAVEQWEMARVEADAARAAVDVIAAEALEKVERAHELYDRAEARYVEVNDLGMRAARLLAEMVHVAAGRLTSTNFAELNEVLVEARKRGWVK